VTLHAALPVGRNKSRIGGMFFAPQKRPPEHQDNDELTLKELMTWKTTSMASRAMN
jgi:hypothetical protein